MRTAPAFRTAEHEYLLKGGRDDRKVAQCQTHQRRGGTIRGIAADGQFVYEIMLLCLVLTLTTLQKLRKMGASKSTKEKTTSELSMLWQAREAAN
jgi:hypothetical protein